ncbi:MAG: hypothetical protein GXC75_01335 [Xanthomonadaceae bacterium]|jgi:hypothetical protein|nr:hypothetical protein [Xanthomonadaceae bacterium]
MTTTLLPSAISHRVAPLLAAIATVMLAGCATSPETLPPAREAVVMAAPDSSSVTDSRALSAEEIGRRFLKLIEGLESREDLNLERVQRVLGVPLKRLDGAPEYLYSFSQPLGDGWYFSVDYISGSPSLLRGVSLEFGRPGERFPEFPAVACALDFELYHSALVEMGFNADPYYDYDHGRERLVDWRYTKFKQIDGSVDMTISIVPRNVVDGEAGRVCVKSIGTLN